MKNRIVTVPTLFASALCIIDTYFVFALSHNAAPLIGWGKVAIAISIQIVLLVSVTIWARTKRKRTSEVSGVKIKLGFPDNFSILLAGLVCAGLTLSLSLLHIAIVCPSESLPEGRGRPMCSYQED